MMRELGIQQRVEVSLSLVDLESMEEMNAEHLGAEGPTDVLAFPMVKPGEEGSLDRSAAAQTLGDIVICVPVAESQASERGHGLIEELELLAAHGLLHLAGYEDETEEGARSMAEAERGLLRRNKVVE